VEYVDSDQLTVDEVAELYESVGWSSYTIDPGQLLDAITRSTYWVTARDASRLVGIARCLSDDFSICYLQDVLVRPETQRQGVGRELVDRCGRRFEHVRQHVLLTDDEEHQHRLCRAAGYSEVAALRNDRLHAFDRIRGAKLS